MSSSAADDLTLELTVHDASTHAPAREVPITVVCKHFLQQGRTIEFVRATASGTSDASGRVRIEMKSPASRHVSRFTADGDWQVIGWTLEGAPDPRAPGKGSEAAISRADITVRAAFRLRGVVVDREGRAISGATIAYSVPESHDGSVHISEISTRTLDEGLFDIGPFGEAPAAGLPPTAPGMWDRGVIFRADGAANLVLDPRGVERDSRGRVVVTMTPGFTYAGVLVDEHGTPVPNAPVAVEYGAVYELRRGVRTDSAGRWRLERLSPGDATLQARAFAVDAKGRRSVRITADDLNVRLVAEPIRLSRAPATTTVLGLALADVDAELRAAYEVPENVRVLIMDPGADPARLGIGNLEKGFGLWMVGDEQVESVREAIEALFKVPNTLNDSRPGSKGVVYTFWDETMSGTNTQSVAMPAETVAELKATLERLGR